MCGAVHRPNLRSLVPPSPLPLGGRARLGHLASDCRLCNGAGSGHCDRIRAAGRRRPGPNLYPVQGEHPEVRPPLLSPEGGVCWSQKRLGGHTLCGLLYMERNSLESLLAS